MKREKRLTKRERKSQNTAQTAHDHGHIHCVACGRHIDPKEFTASPVTARFLRCQHGSQFASCSDCVTESQRRLDVHDRSGQPVQAAAAWH
jgi:hypothetical protein